MTQLLSGPVPRVRTIPASAPFLDTLVEALLAELPVGDPFALADAIIFLPNRRATGGLIEAFARRLGGAALLPAIRPLGDIDDDPEVWGPEPLALNVPPEIAPLRRRFELAQLVRARDAAEGGVSDPVRALAWADELCRLLDAAATVGAVDWTVLDTIVAERDLAAHWRRSSDFLKIVAEYWPVRLKAEGLCDPAQRRATLLEKLAQSWTEAPPQGPVIIAGSTGSVAATRTLMRAAAALPRGVVVLPGLDVELDDAAWAGIDAQHPQHALKDTLEALGVDRRAAPALGVETGPAKARRRLISEALVPANATADWCKRLDAAGGAELVADAARGLTVLEARNENEEALAIALMLREALETEGRTAALVTPDAGLARRVAAKLQRWGLTAQTSVGQSLAESPHGVLLSLLAAVVVDDAEPVALLALLKHPLVALGMDGEERVRRIAALERARVRGPRRWRDLADLHARLQEPDKRTGALGAFAAPLIERLLHAIAPLNAIGEEPDLAQLAEALAESAERLAEGPDLAGAARLWAGPLGEAAAGVLRDMAEYGADLGKLAPRDAPRALNLLLGAREAPPPRGGHPRIAILGPLEARLQRRDLMILGGLVEGVWPASPREDAFLSRGMREALGLPAPEARTGLAAHDFAQLANAPDVVMTRAALREGAPTVASRWLWRLETLARAAGDAEVFAPARARDPRIWARAIDAPATFNRLPTPAPRPPVEARPRRISFSNVETLIRDPYAIYARRVLGLEVLDAPGQEPSHRERGTAIHDALEVFADQDDPAVLLTLIDRALDRAGFDEARRRVERARLLDAATTYAAWNAARRDAGFMAVRETEGELVLRTGHKLVGRADRIDVAPGGRALHVLDFKTGSSPSAKQVETGLSPQLTLEAAAAKRGAFNKDAARIVPALPAEALIYWRFAGSRSGDTGLKLKETTVHDAAEEALKRLETLLERYDDPAQAYFSKPRVQFAKPYADYDHFARRAEWADVEGDEE
jgi:ATP-dependent helicase/nuclease subunit B